jgi:DeoR family transcriptional regulator, fructose operon transcriptional repressor
MYAEERQQAILSRAREAGSVDVDALSTGFEVSQETIRRDLKTLEQAGMVRRVHGGAIAVERLTFEPALDERDRLMTDEKEAIAHEAIKRLPESGSAILIDAGSTTRRFAQILPADCGLTVVTNSPAIGMLLAHRDDLTVMLLGGRLRTRTIATVDEWAIHGTSLIHVDIAFMATNGLSTTHGLTTPDPAEAAIKRAMIGTADEVILLADHTKVDDDYFARFGDVDDVDLLVTDAGLGDDATQQFLQAGLDVVRAQPMQR